MSNMCMDSKGYFLKLSGFEQASCDRRGTRTGFCFAVRERSG